MTLLVVVATICCYTGILLSRCMDTDQSIRSYPDIGELAFGYKGRLLVAAFMYLELYLVAIEFLILEGDNFEKLFPNVGLDVMGVKIGARQEFILIAALFIMPTMWLRNLALLSYVSVGGVVVSVVLAAAVMWAGIVDGVGFHAKGKFFSLNGLPTAISIYSFCYCGHAVFPTIYTSMKNKKSFTKVLVICFVICTINYGATAVAGYLMYGQELSSQITLNLPVGKLSSMVAIYMTLFNPFTKYALIVTPIASAIETCFVFSHKKVMSILVRTFLVASTVVVALTVPFFGYIMALVGSFLSCTASILLPCICYLKISRKSQRSVFEVVIIYVIIVIGALVAVLGTYTSLKDITNRLL